MQRFLEYYWIIYFQVYLICIALLLGEYWGDLLTTGRIARIYLLAAIFSAAAGASAALTIIVEGGGYLVLLIPDRIKKLKNQGREEGLQQGREEGLQQGHAERDQRYDEAITRFAQTQNGQPVLPITPEIHRFLKGEDVPIPPQPSPTRRYARRPRRR